MKESRSLRKAEILLDSMIELYDPWNTEAPIIEVLKIRRLLSKHKQNIRGTEEGDEFSRTKLIWSDNGRNSTKGIEGWVAHLAEVLGDAFGCACAYKTESNSINIFGRKQSLILYYKVLVFFVHHCEANAAKFRKRNRQRMKITMDTQSLRGYVRSHQYAMADLLKEKLDGQYKRSRAASRDAYDGLLEELEAAQNHLKPITMNSNHHYGGDRVHPLGAALSLPYNIVLDKDGNAPRRVKRRVKLL